ncbi:MAG: 16S rRNA (cytosine(1402)-N(4))-methyltransferase RsmH [Clostridiales bacterium]|nr:16S rRNA (cytosine(1402)-N(4))-methyltransferase RsmH [Clostridiales bacterium]
MEFKHIPVMLNEVIDGLEIKKDGVYVDCTVGGGGHSYEIVKRLTTGHLFAFDRDVEAIEKSKQTLKEFADKTTFVKANYKEAPSILKEQFGIEKIDGFLIDLGVSSYQIDEGERGFSFVNDGPLDMRMDQEEDVETAYEIVNTFSYEKLVKIFFEYGEEEFAKQIAKNIVSAREQKKIETTFELREIIENSLPKKIVFSRGGASKKVFQALRICVNKELDELDLLFSELVDMLKKGGRGCVLTFHSLEDRIAKQVFKLESTSCICPPRTPICICGHKAKIKLINRKPIVASEAEQKINSRSTCAKLRVVERI